MTRDEQTPSGQPEHDAADWWEGAAFVRVVGDVHGCLEEFEAAAEDARRRGGRVLSVGDLINRGPDSVGCMRLALRGSEEGWLRIVPGNHDHRLLIRTLAPDDLDDATFSDSTALASTLSELREPEDHGLARDFVGLIADAPVWLRAHDAVFVHAGMPEGGMAGPAPTLRHIRRGCGSLAERMVWGDRPNVSVMPAYDWVHAIPERMAVVAGHYPACRFNPVQAVGDGGGRLVLVDTGAGPVAGQERGRLSWVDLTAGDCRDPGASAAFAGIPRMDARALPHKADRMIRDAA